MKWPASWRESRWVKRGTMPDSTQDWPSDLRINAASISLGAALYDAARTAYAPSMPGFDKLAPSVRRDYILVASGVIKAIRPPHGLAQLARQQMKVVK